MVHSYVNLVDREERVDEGEEDEDDDEEEDEEEAEEVGGLATYCRLLFQQLSPACPRCYEQRHL